MQNGIWDIFNEFAKRLVTKKVTRNVNKVDCGGATAPKPEQRTKQGC